MHFAAAAKITHMPPGNPHRIANTPRLLRQLFEHRVHHIALLRAKNGLA